MVGSRAHGLRLGIDARQEAARRAIGLEVPAPSSPRVREKRVVGLALITCEECGCTYAKVADGKRRPCEFCGGCQ